LLSDFGFRISCFLIQAAIPASYRLSLKGGFAMRHLVGLLLIVLVILHQDYWQWNDTSLELGFLPWTLAYHVGLSLAAALVWFLAVVYCWPRWQDEDAERKGEG